MTFYICVQNNIDTKVHYLSNSSEECHDLNQRTALPPGGTQGKRKNYHDQVLKILTGIKF